MRNYHILLHLYASIQMESQRLTTIMLTSYRVPQNGQDFNREPSPVVHGKVWHLCRKSQASAKPAIMSDPLSQEKRRPTQYAFMLVYICSIYVGVICMYIDVEHNMEQCCV